MLSLLLIVHSYRSLRVFRLRESTAATARLSSQIASLNRVIAATPTPAYTRTAVWTLHPTMEDLCSGSDVDPQQSLRSNQRRRQPDEAMKRSSNSSRCASEASAAAPASNSPGATVVVATAASSTFVEFVRADPMVSAAARIRLVPAGSAAQLLQTALHSEIVAHLLALYRYTRLHRVLCVELGLRPKAATQRLNGWLSAAYGTGSGDVDNESNESDSEESSFLSRIKDDARRVNHIFIDAQEEPAVAEEWWPTVLQSLATGRRRPTHALAVLRVLNQHHDAICRKYPVLADRRQLWSFYLRLQNWSASSVVEDLREKRVLPHASIARAATMATDDEQGEEKNDEELPPPQQHGKRKQMSRPKREVKQRNANEEGEAASASKPEPVIDSNTGMLHARF
jgi:hypothetical protein